jgi:ubiquinone/menaquinone biosynthesis C-methylase UbiE
MSSPAPGYTFSNRPEGPDLHGPLLHHLADMLDGWTYRQLARPLDAIAQLRTGIRCLEVGAGAGTVAHWLARRCGPGGEVVAVDLDPSHIPAHPQITPLAHDITTGAPQGRFDLIHARLVLGHLRRRETVLTSLAAALTPGGALVIEEFDPSWDRSVICSPDPDARTLFSGYHRALLAVLTQSGADPTWGRRVHTLMRHTPGIADVQAEYWSRTWHGGQAGCMLPHVAAAQLRSRLIDAGMTAEDVGRFRKLLLDRRLVIAGNTCVSTTGWAASP